MIPNTDNDLKDDFEIKSYASKTYYLDTDKNRIIGNCDGTEAIKQTIYKILNTERFDYLIYSWNYGIELKNLIGENETYVIPELERVIKEALVQDDRINDVNNFEFKKKKEFIEVTFTVVTNIGDIDMSMEVIV